MSAVPADETNPAAADWLHRLYDGHDGWLTVFAIQRHTGTRTTVWRTTDQIAGLVEAVAALEATCDLWFGVATRHDNLGPGQRGGAEHCRTIPGLWVDIDVRGPNHAATDLPETFEQAVDLVQAFPLAPTAIVATGGGLQAWWLFAEPVAATDVRPLLARWGATWAGLAARHGWHIDNVFDLARIMRLPGTTNRKNDPQPVEVVGVDWTIRYGVDDLEQWTIEATPHLTWQLLTKRPENVSGMAPWLAGDWPVNVWIGTTVEDQQRADERVPILVKIPASVRFLSCEPLLGPVSLYGWGIGDPDGVDDPLCVLHGVPLCEQSVECRGVQWVIVGGESGPKHRPLDLDAARSLRDQCALASVAFFFKQVGGQHPTSGGDLLDGRQHKAFPREAS